MVDKRWLGIKRTYTEQDIKRLRCSVKIEYTLASEGAKKLWKYLHEDDFVPTLGAITGKITRVCIVWLV